MSLGYYTQDSKELFNLLLDIREFASLWLEIRKKTEKHEKVSKEEIQRLNELIEHIADKVEILPLRGRLLKYIIIKRPILLPKFIGEITGIPDMVNKILALLIEYLNYKCDYVVWHDISNTPENIDDYLKSEPQKNANGLMFEIIIRRWLKEIKKEHWINTQSFSTLIKPRNRHGIEIDALSITRQQNQYNIAAAEIKWTLVIKDTGEAIHLDKSLNKEISVSKKFSESLESLTEHFEKWLKITTNYKEIALISGGKISEGFKQKARDYLFQELAQTKIKLNTPQIIQIYDIDDVWNTVKDTSHPLKDVVKQIRRLRPI